MLAPLAPLIGLMVGLFFAWAGTPKEPGPRAGISSQALLLVIMFSVSVFAPVAAYFLAFAPDWSYAYLVDSEQLPSTVDLALVIVDTACVPAGFFWGSQYARARPPSGILRLAAGLGLACLLFIAISIRRLGVDASYAQYHGDFGTRPLAGSPLGYAVLWMLAILGGATAWTAHHLKLMVTRR